MLKFFLTVMIAALPGSLQCAPAEYYLELATADEEAPLDEAKLKTLIDRVRAGDDSAIAEFEKVIGRETLQNLVYRAEVLAGESVEVRKIINAYILLTIEDWYGWSKAGTVYDAGVPKASVEAVNWISAYEEEPPLDEAKMKALIQRVRAGDDAAIAEFEKVYTSVVKYYFADITEALANEAEALAGESVEVRTIVRAYILLSLAESNTSSEAGTIRDMLVEGVKFEKLAYAQNAIGERFYYGNWVHKDDVEAVKWFRLAAAQGDAAAQTNLGWMYYYGYGVPKNAFEAVNWFRLSAVSGNRDGEFALAVMYDEGAGIREDDAQAVNWYTLAAQQGHSDAQNNLGVMYADGRGVPEDDVMAVKWYRASAMQDEPGARWKLGRMYRDGEGVPKDLVTAYAWLLLAMTGEVIVSEDEGMEAKDVAKAKKDFRRLRIRLSVSQREQARQLASRLLEEK